MTKHYFSNDLVTLHYYRFGHGDKSLFCFHGYGMHGRQFRILEEGLGNQYTFFGFDLFFHKETVLNDQSLAAVKRGISKMELAGLFKDFCDSIGLQEFSIIAYSMGSHYASALVEEMPGYIKEVFIAAPSIFRPGRILRFFSSNLFGNKILENMVLSDKRMLSLLAALRRSGIIDQKAHDILYREMSTRELRFSFYACLSYMRFLVLDPSKFVRMLNEHQIKSVFFFGERDKNYPAAIGERLISEINLATKFVINENHDMINTNFAKILSDHLNDH